MVFSALLFSSPQKKSGFSNGVKNFITTFGQKQRSSPPNPNHLIESTQPDLLNLQGQAERETERLNFKTIFPDYEIIDEMPDGVKYTKPYNLKVFEMERALVEFVEEKGAWSGRFNMPKKILHIKAGNGYPEQYCVCGGSTIKLAEGRFRFIIRTWNFDKDESGDGVWKESVTELTADFKNQPNKILQQKAKCAGEEIWLDWASWELLPCILEGHVYLAENPTLWTKPSFMHDVGKKYTVNGELIVGPWFVVNYKDTHDVTNSKNEGAPKLTSSVVRLFDPPTVATGKVNTEVGVESPSLVEEIGKPRNVSDSPFSVSTTNSEAFLDAIPPSPEDATATSVSELETPPDAPPAPAPAASNVAVSMPAIGNPAAPSVPYATTPGGATGHGMASDPVGKTPAAFVNQYVGSPDDDFSLMMRGPDVLLHAYRTEVKQRKKAEARAVQTARKLDQSEEERREDKRDFNRRFDVAQHHMMVSQKQVDDVIGQQKLLVEFVTGGKVKNTDVTKAAFTGISSEEQRAALADSKQGSQEWKTVDGDEEEPNEAGAKETDATSPFTTTNSSSLTSRSTVVGATSVTSNKNRLSTNSSGAAQPKKNAPTKDPIGTGVKLPAAAAAHVSKSSDSGLESSGADAGAASDVGRTSRSRKSIASTSFKQGATSTSFKQGATTGPPKDLPTRDPKHAGTKPSAAVGLKDPPNIDPNASSPMSSVPSVSTDNNSATKSGEALGDDSVEPGLADEPKAPEVEQTLFHMLHSRFESLSQEQRDNFVPGKRSGQAIHPDHKLLATLGAIEKKYGRSEFNKYEKINGEPAMCHVVKYAQNYRDLFGMIVAKTKSGYWVILHPDGSTSTSGKKKGSLDILMASFDYHYQG